MKKFLLILSVILTIESCAKSPNHKLIFRFAGDVMFDRGIRRVLKRGVDPFANVLNITRKADLMMVNLETTVATNGHKITKAFNFMSDPASLRFLTNAGVDLVSLANKHVMDYDWVALKQTRENLERYGIRFTGSGRNIYEATRPLIFTNHGIILGYLAFGDIYPLSLYAGKTRAGVVSTEPKNVLKAIRLLRPKVDVLVVSLHWGWEYEDFPRRYQIGQAHAFIDAGADLVLGHHPHVLQGVERYKNRMIFYSMGNFVFDQRIQVKTRYTMIGEMKAEETILSNRNTNWTLTYAAYPLIKDATNYMPRRLNAVEKGQWLRHFNEICAPFGTTNFTIVSNKITWLSVHFTPLKHLKK